jgi:hypothetical protein
MKTKILFCFLLSALEISAATIEVNTRTFTSEPTQRRRTTLTLIEAGPVVAGPWLIAGDSVAAFTSTNGVAYYSNVLAGSYRLDIAGTPGRSFPITVPDTNGVLSAAALVNSTNINTHFYTATQVDALIAGIVIDGGGTPGALTNADSRTVYLSALRTTNDIISSGTVVAYGGIGSVFGQFEGDGAGLTNIPQAGVTGLSDSFNTTSNGLLARLIATNNAILNLVPIRTFVAGTNIVLLTNSSTLTIHGTATGGSSTQTNISHTAVTNLTDRLAQFAATNAVDAALITGDLAIEDAYFTNAFFLRTNGLAYFDANGQLQLSNTISAALVPAALTNNDTRVIALFDDFSSGAGKEQQMTVNESVGFVLTNLNNTSSFSVDPEGIVTTTGSYIGNGIGLTNIIGTNVVVDTTGFDGNLASSGATNVQRLAQAVDDLTVSGGGLSTITNRGYMLFPDGALGITAATQPFTTSNRVHVFRHQVYAPVSLSNVVVRIVTADVGKFFGLSLYTGDGNTRVWDSGPITGDNTGAVSINFTPITIEPGVYYMGWSANSTTLAYSGANMDNAWLYFLLPASPQVFHGYAANTGLAGQNPPTLGALTDDIIVPPLLLFSK